MSVVIGVLRKELRIYFTTPTAYVVLSLFTVVASVFFWTFLARYMADSQAFIQAQRPELLDRLNFNDRVITPLYVGYVQLIFLFVMPLLTMRLIAEERRTRSIELLLSSPISSWQIVLGKYLSALVLVLAMCGVALIYPLLLSIFGRGAGASGAVDWASVWLGVLGLFFVGAVCAAVGLLSSSLSDNQIVAAVVGMMTLLFFWLLRGVGTSLEGAPAQILRELSLLTHIESYARGILSLGDLFYFAAMIGFFLFLAQRMVESLRWN